MNNAKKVIIALCMMVIFTPFTVYSIEVTPAKKIGVSTAKKIGVSTAKEIGVSTAKEIPTINNETQTATLDLSTDKTNYTTGNIIQFKITMDGDATVDVYMTAIFPDGSFASYTTTMMPDSENVIIPLIKDFPLGTYKGTYTLPLPVIPLWPEGTSEIWMVFVKTQKNPMVSANWLAQDKVTFTVDQADDVEPLFDLESKTFTAPLGDMGTITITFGGANVDGDSVIGVIEGTLTFTGPTGTTNEGKITGIYIYENETLTVHIEGDEQANNDLSLDIQLTLNDDHTLTGSYETSKGKSGDINFALPKAL